MQKYYFSMFLRENIHSLQLIYIHIFSKHMKSAKIISN